MKEAERGLAGLKSLKAVKSLNRWSVNIFFFLCRGVRWVCPNIPQRVCCRRKGENGHSQATIFTFSSAARLAAVPPDVAHLNLHKTYTSLHKSNKYFQPLSEDKIGPRVTPIDPSTWDLGCLRLEPSSVKFSNTWGTKSQDVTSPSRSFVAFVSISNSFFLHKTS